MKCLFPILLLCIVLSSCVAEKNWEYANITFKDSTEKTGYVYVNKASYYNFFRAKNEMSEYRKIYQPEEVLSVTCANSSYISIPFDEATFGMDSYSFGKIIAGNSLILAVTKFQQKTCSCKTSGGYFKGYFLLYNGEIKKVELKKNEIQNINELNKFIESKSLDFEIPKNVHTIESLTELINSSNI